MSSERNGDTMMKKKVICCVGLVLSMICLIGCAAKGTQDTSIPTPAVIPPQTEAPAASEPQSIPESEQTTQETTTPVVEQAKTADTPVNADTEVPQAAPAPATQPKATEDIPSETVHAKTGYVEPEPTPEPGPTPEPTAPANRQAAIDAANAYAVTQYGVITDGSLTLDNSAYRFPASVAADASQEVLEAKARDMVDYTFWQLMMQAGVDTLADAGFHCNVCIVEDGASLLIYVLYAG